MKKESRNRYFLKKNVFAVLVPEIQVHDKIKNASGVYQETNLAIKLSRFKCETKLTPLAQDDLAYR